MALIITRKRTESFYIGDSKVTIVKITGNKTTIAIEAQQGVNIRRSELEKHNENLSIPSE